MKHNRMFLISTALLMAAVAGVAAEGSEDTAAKYRLTNRTAIGGAGGWDYLTFDGTVHRLATGTR